MKQWFPFTDYDFYAYITAGMLLIASIDYTVGGAVLFERTQWTVVQIVFWTAVAYLTGQLLAGPSSAMLEHGVARRLLHPPLAVSLGLKERRRREKLAAMLFAGREYAPLSTHARAHILAGAATALNVPPAELTDPEDVFGVAYRVARDNPGAVVRMNQFRNLYGFSRNVAFVGLIATGLLTVKLWQVPVVRTAWLLAAALVLAVGMFGRFLKFYAAFSREVLGAYGAKLSAEAKAASA